MLDKLRAIVGPTHVLTGVDRSPYVIEGRTPEAAVLPGTVDEVAAVVAHAAEAAIPVVPWGGGSAIGVGVPPARAGIILVLTRLDALVEHEPGDLTLAESVGGAAYSRLARRRLGGRPSALRAETTRSFSRSSL